MKKIISILLILVMCLDLVACGEPAHIHEFGEWIITQTPTCTQSGMQERYCNCGEKQETTLGAQHDYTETVVQILTCEQSGLCKFTCKTCGHNYEETTDAPGHDWQSASCTTSKVCSRCQTESGEPLGHNYSNGACTRCGMTRTGTVTVKNTLPATFRSNVPYLTKGSIDAVTYSFSGSTLKVDIDYHKTYDEKGNNAMSGFWFYITIYDKDNTPVASDTLAINKNGVVNQKMHITYKTTLDASQDYTILFSEYYL